MKGRKTCSTLFLSLALSAALVFPGAAAEAAGSDIPDGTQQEKNAGLSDNVLEYSELQDMISSYNPTVQEVADSRNRTVAQYEDAWSELKLYQGRVSTDIDQAKDSGNMEEYSYYKAQEQTYKAAASSYYKMLDRMNTASSTSTQRQVTRQMTVAAQSLMVSYETLRQQRDTLLKMRELYTAQYQLGQVKEQTGLATSVDVLSLKNQVLTAESSLATVEENMESLYSSICLMVGREPDGSLEIASIPSADLTRISAMDLEADTQKAIGNNYTLMSDRHSLNVNSTSSSQYKLRTMEHGEQKLTSEMKRLYEDVLLKKDALEQAQTGYEKARQTKQQADIKYGAGMLSREDYLREELSCIQKEADLKAADLALEQALDTYDWAVLGIADVE